METVIKPGELYHIYLVNDSDFNGEVLSIDEHWVEFAVEHTLGFYTFEIFPKSIIKKLLPSEKSRKKYWVLDTSAQRMSAFSSKTLSDDEITFTRVKSTAVIFDDREDAIEYIKQLKVKENNTTKCYAVESEDGGSYEYF